MNQTYECITYNSPVGILELKATNQGLFWLKKSYELKGTSSKNIHLSHAVNWLDYYFSQMHPPKQLPALDLNGTEFQMNVWNVLLTVPFGQNRSYRQIEQIYNQRHNAHTSPRAIGKAIASNPVWIIIPCHRIIYNNGKPGGYAGGSDMKIALQKIEQYSKKD